MKTENRMTNIKFIFEYNRDTDGSTPNKINKSKELFSICADYCFLNIGFSCGINSEKDTICNFNTYIKEGADMHYQHIKELKYKLFLIWGAYTYIQDNKLNKFNKQN